MTATLVAGVLLAAIVPGWMVLRVHVRWFARTATAEIPYIQVEADLPADGSAAATLTLRGTSRSFAIARATASREHAERFCLTGPEGWHPAHDVEPAQARATGRPLRDVPGWDRLREIETRLEGQEPRL